MKIYFHHVKNVLLCFHKFPQFSKPVISICLLNTNAILALEFSRCTCVSGTDIYPFCAMLC